MIGKGKTGIQTGDRFAKVGDKDDVWVIKNRWDGRYPVPHYELVMEGREARRRTLSEAVLLDPAHYRRADD
ncbi:MAG: hypothetical protein ACYYKD_07710 [Rhodospirillales bacterium]